MNVTGEESGEQLARGTKWIQMVGELGMVSVSGGDQVMRVEAGEERGTRTGVTAQRKLDPVELNVSTRSGKKNFENSEPSENEMKFKILYTTSTCCSFVSLEVE